MRFALVHPHTATVNYETVERLSDDLFNLRNSPDFAEYLVIDKAQGAAYVARYDAVTNALVLDQTDTAAAMRQVTRAVDLEQLRDLRDGWSAEHSEDWAHAHPEMAARLEQLETKRRDAAGRYVRQHGVFHRAGVYSVRWPAHSASGFITAADPEALADKLAERMGLEVSP